MKASSHYLDITPQASFNLAGYVPFQKATGVLDDINLSGVLLEIDNKELLLINIDLCMISEAISSSIQHNLKDYISPSQIIISATHNHSGPAVMDIEAFGSTSSLEEHEYRVFLANKSIELYVHLKEHLEEVTAYYGEIEIKDIYSSRLHQDEHSNKMVNSILFKNSQGIEIARYINISTHSTVLGTDNTLYSGDLIGNLAKRIYKETSIYPLIHIGASGNSSTRFYRTAKDRFELTKTVTELYNQIKFLTHNEKLNTQPLHINTIAKSIVYNVDVKATQLELDEISKQILIEENTIQKKLLISKKFALETKLQRDGNVIDFTIPIYMLGDITFVSLPFEVDSKLFDMITSDKVFFVTLSNNYLGYIMSKDDYENTYEGLSSILNYGEAELLITEIYNDIKK